MLMQPNQYPPAPPPMHSPNNPGLNPYDFLLDKPKKSKSFLPSGNSTKQRIIIVVVIIIIIFVAGSIILSLLGSSGKSASDDLLVVAQKQTEIIRVTNIGYTKARDKSTKNLALTAELSILSDQAPLLVAMKKSGIDVSKSQLVLGKNTSTDAKLTLADQDNNFDDVFNQTLIGSLGSYQTAVKKAYDETNSTKTKLALVSSLQNVGKILSNQQ